MKEFDRSQKSPRGENGSKQFNDYDYLFFHFTVTIKGVRDSLNKLTIHGRVCQFGKGVPVIQYSVPILVIR
jgi:hypothetical protein